ncbi:hypothetical protein HGA88_02325 [Candidatus Roizmanbacteria bacterium]|nr:hypothetical protein [Candidatus Roizmanbacteria bacterium]
MQRILNFLSFHRYPLFLSFIVLILGIANYHPGSFLSGWDNIQTDLNPWLGVKRAVFSVWEEYQSFGLVSGMAHAADLVRAVFIWMLSFVLPQSFLRYFFHVLMLGVGTMGMYWFLVFTREHSCHSGKRSASRIDNPGRFPTSGNDERGEDDDATPDSGQAGMTLHCHSRKRSMSASGIVVNRADTSSFLGALFYLLNFATIQMFYVPFEAFSVFSAFLPWEIWIFMKLLEQKKWSRKDVILFVVINFLATPQAYVQTLFIVYGVMLGVATVTLTFHRKQKERVTREWGIPVHAERKASMCGETSSGRPPFFLKKWILNGTQLNGSRIGVRDDNSRNNDSGLRRNDGRENPAPTFQLLKRSIALFLLLFSINAFWLLPQLYFLKTNQNVVTEAKSNMLATEDVLYQNKEKGTIDQFIPMRGFYYDLFDADQKQLFEPWKQHFQNPLFAILSYLFALIWIIGIFAKSRYRWTFLSLLFVVAIALLNNTPPFSWINDFLRKNEIVNQLFRSPFTKFAIPYAFVASYFFAVGVERLQNGCLSLGLPRTRRSGAMPVEHGWEKANDRPPFCINSEQRFRASRNDVQAGGHLGPPLRNSSGGKTTSNVAVAPPLHNHGSSIRSRMTMVYSSIVQHSSLIIVIVIVLSALPAFTGNYFARSMHVSIPNDYLQVMQYLQHQDKNKRIALLPDYTFWGWFYTRWGYNGSGFLWYGIEQPIVSRTFDVWSDKSEGYFWEMKTAIESEQVQKFDQLLEKYDIDYLILDYSLLPVSASLKGLQYERIERILAHSEHVSLVQKGKNVLLYQVINKKPVKNFISLATELPNIGPTIKLTNDDTAYTYFGDYKTDATQPFDYYFPYLDLTTQTRLKHKLWTLSEQENQFRISQPLLINAQDFELKGTVTSAGYQLYLQNEVQQFKSTLSHSIENNMLVTTIAKEPIYQFDVTNTSVHNCSPLGTTSRINSSDLTVSSTNRAIGCFGYEAPALEQKNGYLVKIASKLREGRPLFLYILDQTKRQAFLEDRLLNSTEYFILSPKYQYGLGYSFSFNNNSYHNIPSTNTLQELSVYQFPYDQLKQTFFESKTTHPTNAKFAYTIPAEKLNYYTYKVTIPDQKISTVILNQSFHPGWTAFVIPACRESTHAFPLSILDTLVPRCQNDVNHVIINNWANGWTIPQGTKEVVLIFWPQYLEYVGFGVLLLTVIIAILHFSLHQGTMRVWYLSGTTIVKNWKKPKKDAF